MMRARFDPIFRAALVFLLATTAWSLWAGAQTVTNQAEAILSNRPTPMLLGVERFEEHHMSFGLDQVGPLRELKLLGEPLWKYLASLIYVLLAFCAARFVDFGARVWLRRLASRTQTELDDLLLELIHGPVRLLTFVLFLNLGITIFEWSEAAKLFLSKGLILIVASSLTYLGVKVSNLLLDVWKRRTARDGDVKFDDQLFSIIRRSLSAFVIVVGVLVAAQNLGVNITAAVTSLSIGGLAVGLAAQDTLANLFGAVAVFMDKPFRLGDQIKLDNAEGQVEVVGLRSTRLDRKSTRLNSSH